MSWLDNLNNEFVITTGDKLEYRPKWINATKTQDYNLTIFEFINVEGSLVRRQKAKGRRFPLEFYFDGEDHLDIGNNFEISARNKNAWKLTHPYYGNITCQPLGLIQDNSVYNVTKFTCTVIETLGEGYPKPEAVAIDNINTSLETLNTNQAIDFDNVNEFNRSDLKIITEELDQTYSAIIDDENELNEFKALVDIALTVIDDFTETGLNLIRAMQNVINYPIKVTQTVQARYNVLQESLDYLNTNIEGITSQARTIADKMQYQVIAGCVLGAQQVVSVTEPDYEVRTKVIGQQQKLLDEYNNYIQILDENQTDRADDIDSYHPDFVSLNSASELINLTIANLFEIAFNSKQERTYTLTKDSNIILLTHKFYELDENDENLEKFIETNNIGLNEFLNIEKDRQVIYYI